ncbi:MAG: tRNA-specific adenosine deaminase, partial [Acidobacteria bacterium]|nr:tRNA-specific adenosine deaminase [Acidobacteriota bacterium]
AAAIGFDDHFIYDEIERPIEERRIKSVNLMRNEGLKVFKNWTDKTDKTEY